MFIAFVLSKCGFGKRGRLMRTGKEQHPNSNDKRLSLRNSFCLVSDGSRFYVIRPKKSVDFRIPKVQNWRMKKNIAILVLTVLIAGCTTTGHVEPGTMSAISIGMTRDQVIQAVGRPESVAAHDNLE